MCKGGAVEAMRVVRKRRERNLITAATMTTHTALAVMMERDGSARSGHSGTAKPPEVNNHKRRGLSHLIPSLILLCGNPAVRDYTGVSTETSLVDAAYIFIQEYRQYLPMYSLRPNAGTAIYVSLLTARFNRYLGYLPWVQTP